MEHRAQTTVKWQEATEQPKKQKISIRSKEKKIVMSVVKHWKRLHREAMKPSSLEVFRTHLDMVLNKQVLIGPTFEQGLRLDDI